MLAFFEVGETTRYNKKSANTQGDVSSCRIEQTRSAEEKMRCRNLEPWTTQQSRCSSIL